MMAFVIPNQKCW
jgi:hypothetical protein